MSTAVGGPPMALTRMRQTPAQADASSAEAPRSSPRGRVVAGLLLALCTPLLVQLATPPFEIWPLIFVAFVPMVIAQHHVLPRRLSGLAVGVGIGGSYAVYFSRGLADGQVGIVYQLLPVY